MQTLICLIVEDEPLAAKVIRDYIEEVPGLRCGGVCNDAFSAREELLKEKIDVLFLDINLPKVSGLDFIKSLSGKQHVILTTAYHQYALDGYNLNAVDYLLKPVEFSRFLQAVDKVFELRSTTVFKSDEEHTYAFFKVDKKMVKVYMDDILFIESIRDYVKIHTKERTILTKYNIGDLASGLPQSFIRVHKSFIVNLNSVTAFNSSGIETGNFRIPVGRSYKEQVEKLTGH